MKRKVSALEARRHFGRLLEDVSNHGDEVVIERAGKPVAVVIPSARYASLEHNGHNGDRLWEVIEKFQEANASVPAEELQADIDAAIAEVRAARRE
jgi:prevent-host-death family protein